MTKKIKNLIYAMIAFLSAIIVVVVLFYLTGTTELIIDKLESLN